ncbi:hypothetical protein DM860_002048 [Cuscuta australis]|uniref:Uncharacterized protein n=1 Tax=Cuscuta australis TaxID=267555 RepID=A0A328DVL2_9ASTE|nr:hypothetical protein DM860_002048 [Cuscuta australis]
MGAVTASLIAIAGVALGWITIEMACKPCLDKGRQALDRSLNPDYDPDDDDDDLRAPLVVPNPNPLLPPNSSDPIPSHLPFPVSSALAPNSDPVHFVDLFQNGLGLHYASDVSFESACDDMHRLTMVPKCSGPALEHL